MSHYKELRSDKRQKHKTCIQTAESEFFLSIQNVIKKPKPKVYVKCFSGGKSKAFCFIHHSLLSPCGRARFMRTMFGIININMYLEKDLIYKQVTII